MVGRTLGQYRLVDKLGEGGMGVVYLAEDSQLGRRVALKILPPELASEPERLERFRREARTLASLNHPGIVTVHSVEEVDGLHLLTMEVVEGRPLDERIAAGRLPLEELLAIGIETAEVLAVAHTHGVVHRDLKPANLMLGPEGRVKLLDFGLAKPGVFAAAPEAATLGLTQAGQLLGTVPYMSPEQVEGGPVDPRTDLFSLGAILYEMATGKTPFQGDSSPALMSSILRDSPAPLGESRRDLPPRLAEIVGRCLEKKPDQRFQSAIELRDALRELQRQLDSERLLATIDAAAPARAERAAAGRRIAAGAAAAAIVAALGFGWWLSRRADSGEPPAAAAPADEPISIAVLPFLSLSTEEENEIFCDGLTEELIHSLVKVDGLAVPARTSVFALKGQQMDVREAGRRLGVDNVLEGSVRRSGDKLRVTAQLIEVASGFHLWSQTYDRELEDVFAIQDGIARSIVGALELTLDPEVEAAIRADRAADAAAYDYYLRGQGYYRRQTRDSMLRARRMFERAIEIDAGYAPAWAGLAITLSAIYLNYDSSQEHLAEADRASRKALELDPGLAVAHRARASALAATGHHEESEREYERAIELDPRLADTYRAYGISSFARGELEKAAQLFERAGELDPDDYRTVSLLPQIYRSLGRPEDEAASHRRQLAVVERHLELAPDDVQALLRGAGALVAMDRTEQGLEWARRALAAGAGDALVLYNVACLFSLTGDTEAALDALEASFRAGLADPEWMAHDSDLDPIRDEPRYRRLIEQMEGVAGEADSRGSGG